jgi:phenylalanyl-tRNA synthetase alpha chain
VHHGEWIEIGECGLAHPALLAEAGLDPGAWSGLAMGLGLDRLLMLRKSIDDIRLLRAADPRVASQLLDLAPYARCPRWRCVMTSRSSSMARSMSRRSVTRARLKTVPRSSSRSSPGQTACDQLPPPRRAARSTGQHNVLVAIMLARLDRTLTHAECNELRDDILSRAAPRQVWHWAVKASGGR